MSRLGPILTEFVRVSSAPVPTEAKQLLARMASKARATMFLQYDSSALLPHEDTSTP